MVDAEMSETLYLQRVVAVCVLGISVAVWVLLFLAYFLVPGAIANNECGLDPLTNYETDRCAPVAAWGSFTFWSWLASPLTWMASGLALLWARKDRIGFRWSVVASMPVLPLIGMASVFVIEALYGPSPV
ncbi:hypothetical protein ACIBKY_43110 [Nonomuraea sp. NPDC050394]|uniref:hypothetical protein n=1 Tax=Nonomuraea sp. NPDC050394 TaxID=3364363 RepID=UPI0037AC774F